jgi:hypothetical protein
MTINLKKLPLVLHPFALKHIQHRAQIAAHRLLVDACLYQPTQGIVFLVGPTGVGKTTLLSKAAKELVDAYQEDMKEDPSMMPLLMISAKADGVKNFSFKEFYRRLLESTGDPFSSAPRRVWDESEGKLRALERDGAAVRRDVLEDVLKRRRTEILIVDEAQHMLMTGIEGTPGDRLDVLKSFHTQTGITLVLTGTYDLPWNHSNNGQLNRRRTVVHLARYQYTDKAELSAFSTCASHLLKALPLPGGYPSVIDHVDTYYFGSLGCVGILKEWLLRAATRVIREERTALTADDLKATKLRGEDRRRIAHEISTGEEAFLSADPEKEIKDLLSTERRPQHPATVERPSGKSPAHAKGLTSGTTKGRSLRIGRRSPGRDATGYQPSRVSSAA